MTNEREKERAAYVQGMFARIAPRYDLMNRIMTAGQDARWRREVIARAGLPEDGRLLDLGAGTGDLSFEAKRRHPRVRVTAGDFTLGMMQVGKRRPLGGEVVWTAADALHLPFGNSMFDAVISGFLLRNVTNLAQALREQQRVLRPGGRIVALDTTRPVRSLWSPFIWLHLHWVIPVLGRLLTGQADAYRYLPESTEGFLEAGELARRMTAAGFHEVGYRRVMFGTVGIHWGVKGN